MAQHNVITIAWGNKVSQEFRDKLLEICEKDFEWPEGHASWVMSCIAFETGETFSPKIRNAAGSGATGLIQFMPQTADNLGVTTAILSVMTAVEQLDYVKKYFEPYHKKIKSLSDMYMAILAPKYIGFPEDTVLYANGAAYRQNSALDVDGDGRITKKEATRFVEAKLFKGLLADNVYVETGVTKPGNIQDTHAPRDAKITNLLTTIENTIRDLLKNG
jgi:hypothetical protein